MIQCSPVFFWFGLVIGQDFPTLEARVSSESTAQVGIGMGTKPQHGYVIHTCMGMGMGHKCHTCDTTQPVPLGLIPIYSM